MTRPAVNRAQMEAIERHAIEELGIPARTLMENAGRAVAEAARSMSPCGRITVLAGSGNNGGDGFVAARHLAEAGASVRVLAFGAEKLRGDALFNFERLGSIETHRVDRPEIGHTDLIIDAIFGTGLRATLRDPWPAHLRQVNSLRLPILAVDVPSGLDCDTGLPLGEALVAVKTVTFHAPKIGFTRGRGPEFTGEVTVADIGIPG